MGTPNVFHEHTRASEAAAILPAEWSRYFTFAVDRNPWDLTVSAYDYWLETRTRRGAYVTSFAEFVQSEHLAIWSNWSYYTHRNRVVVDELYPFDLGVATIAADVATRLGITELPPVPHARSGSRDLRDYRKWYTPVLRDRVADVFHREIEHFGWTF